MTNEEKLVLEKFINNARDDIQHNIKWAKHCANAFLDKTEKAQGNWGNTRKEIEELVCELENVVRANEYCNAKITAIEEMQYKLEK